MQLKPSSQKGSPRWNPQDYAKNSAGQLKWAQELRSHIRLQGDETILDVGCGDGKITADFAHHVPHGSVTGIDSSPEMIAYATQTYATADYPNLTFACMDARRIPFTNTFDLIFSNSVLQWVDDHLAVLKGASAALRPGGRLVISCGGQGNAGQILEAVFEVARRDRWRQYFTPLVNPYYFLSPADYRPWLAETGLQVDRLELVPKDMIHAGKTGLAGWLRTTWMPFTERVPVAERELFIAEVVDAYGAHVPLDSAGLVHVSMVRLEVEAHKPHR